VAASAAMTTVEWVSWEGIKLLPIDLLWVS